MSTDFISSTQGFNTILDFLRFGLTRANEKELYFGHGTDNAWDDLLTLILTSLSLPLDMHEALLHAKLTEQEKKQLAILLEKRIIERIPVPYLTNEAWFCDLKFYVNEKTLIPRSPIAELIKQQFEPWVNPEKVFRVLDMCTGSGCIAIACAYAFPDAEVDAVELSDDAIQVARKNILNHQLTGQVHVIKSDCFDDVPQKQYDLIVSNPPYVGREEMQTLPNEYRHEPVMALETENNGLAVVEKMLRQAHDYLSDDGVFIVEVGNSDEALAMAYPDVPFIWLELETGGHGVFMLTRDVIQTHFCK